MDKVWDHVDHLASGVWVVNEDLEQTARVLLALKVQRGGTEASDTDASA